MRAPVAILLLLVPCVGSSSEPDASAYDRLLRKNVVNGMVNYDAFSSAPEFRTYLASLDQTDPSSLAADAGNNERLAFLINAYNAYTIELIVRHHERDSIRNVDKSLGRSGRRPWREKVARVGGSALSLDDLEDLILGKPFDEPRVHFALARASMGSPPLRSEAYTASRLETQLAEQTSAFLLRSPKKNRVDLMRSTLFLSPVVSWHKEAFGSNAAAIARTLSAYFPEGPEKELLGTGRVRVEETDYDWTLNSQEKAALLKHKAGAN